MVYEADEEVCGLRVALLARRASSGRHSDYFGAESRLNVDSETEGLGSGLMKQDGDGRVGDGVTEPNPSVQ